MFYSFFDKIEMLDSEINIRYEGITIEITNPQGEVILRRKKINEKGKLAFTTEECDILIKI